jgi:hypothetical protein
MLRRGLGPDPLTVPRDDAASIYICGGSEG